MRSFNLPLGELILLEPGSIPKSTSGKVRRQPCKVLFEKGQLGTSRSEQDKLNFALVRRVARSGVTQMSDFVGGLVDKYWRRDGEGECA